MDDCEKLLAEKDAKIRELEEKIRELEKKLRRYELKSIYDGIIPEDVLESILDLPPEKLVFEIGKYLKKSVPEKTKQDQPLKMKESPKTAETKEKYQESSINARVGVDLAYTHNYDFEGSDVAFLSEDLAVKLGVKEGDYVTVKKNGSINMRVQFYSKPGFIILPTWVRDKIGAKVNDFVEVVRR